eukprot:4134548-Pleurochrysis_carterae.AAC.1
MRAPLTNSCAKSAARPCAPAAPAQFFTRAGEGRWESSRRAIAPGTTAWWGRGGGCMAAFCKRERRAGRRGRKVYCQHEVGVSRRGTKRSVGENKSNVIGGKGRRTSRHP